MDSISSQEIKIIMAVIIFIIGVITFWIGVGILVFKTMGKDQRAIAAQATRLAQKGLAEDIAGLLGNVSSLLNAMNDMVRTSAGIAIFLIVIGLILMIIAISFALQIQ